VVSDWCVREMGRMAIKVFGALEAPVPHELKELSTRMRRKTQRHDELMAQLKRLTADTAH
jgi:hypothetical protein